MRITNITINTIQESIYNHNEIKDENCTITTSYKKSNSQSKLYKNLNINLCLAK